jgi:hypothetical protein
MAAASAKATVVTFVNEKELIVTVTKANASS